MTQYNYEGTNPCLEIELAWRHDRVEYITRLIEGLRKEEQYKILNYLEDKIVPRK